MYSSYSVNNSALDGVGGQHHTAAALYPRGKDPRYPLYRRLGGPQSRSGHRGKILCLCWGSKPSRRVRSQTLYSLSYPGFPVIIMLILNLVVRKSISYKITRNARNVHQLLVRRYLKRVQRRRASFTHQNKTTKHIFS
jgi:hypothetical protein